MFRILVLLLLIILTQTDTFGQAYRFFNVNAGLSSSRINAVQQDYEGYIWIATEDGLNRFDGSSFHTYRNIPNDSTSLPNNHVRQIIEDTKHRLWIATMTGLCLYDRDTDTFEKIELRPENCNSSNMQIYDIIEDTKGQLWFSISEYGIFALYSDIENMQCFQSTNSEICSNQINCILEDSKGNIWFGSGEDGISIYDPSCGKFINYQTNDGSGLGSNKISSLCNDSIGRVWVATLTGGIFIYSHDTKKFQPLDKIKEKEILKLMTDKNGDIWISSYYNNLKKYISTKDTVVDLILDIPEINTNESVIHALFQDCQDNIWVGLFQKGLLLLSSEKQMFQNYRFNPFLEGSIKEGAIVPVYCDSFGEIWIGKDGGGLFRLDKDKHILQYFHSQKNNSENIIVSLFEDSRHDIWIGTYLSGIMRFNRRKNSIDLKISSGNSPKTLNSHHVTDFKETADGKLWIATNGGGLNIYDPQSGTFDYIKKSEAKTDNNQLIDNWCNVLFIDKDSILWIGTYKGLCNYDMKNKKFMDYYKEELPNEIVHTIEEDTLGNIWVGTQDGLVCIPPKSNRSMIRSYGIKEGLPNSLILNIKKDNDGNLWITTGNGLSMMEITTKNFHNYTTANGLATSECNQKSLSLSPFGEFVFGTTQGFTSFYPEKKGQSVIEPLKLALNDLYIHNRPVAISSEKDAILKSTLDKTRYITLNDKQNSFSISFSAIEYMLPENVNYEVMLEGFDQKWHSASNKLVTYTNLPPKNYVLRIKAWRNNREKGLERQINIRTLPSPWAHPYMKSVYILLILITTTVIWRHLNKIAKNRREEKILQEKLQFFTDISHEIRTPLTLIMGPLSKLISKSKDSTLLPTYNIMYKHANRLLNLVNQIMDLRAIEFNKKRILVKETNITQFVSAEKESFNSLAEEKGLDFVFISEGEITGYIDQNIISQILFNLISNAIKYTEQGRVCVKIGLLKQKNLFILIEDTGKGISKEMQEKIFERFFMINHENTNKYLSSGIGLHLTNKIVQLHHGSIYLESELGKGSSFTIILPINKDSYAEEEIDKESALPIVTHKPIHIQTDIPLTIKKGSHPQKILIVEDNKDIRSLISTELSENYRIIEADNGKDALRICMEEKPDLVISDILMSEMDGIELCKKIRNNETLRSTPVILVSARTSNLQQTEGIKSGADAYVTKPFDIEYLKALVCHFTHKPTTKTAEEKQEPNDSSTQFAISRNNMILQKMDTIIKEHLDDTGFGVDILCQELGFSRSHLNRKIKELTGSSPASYIKQVRLQIAVNLLKKGDLSVSEIAYMTGFSSPSYFSQAFREFYGIPPKEYISYNSSN
ncbi:two-component regulator propeller domain-containing protein [uncultured Parabacteroides sp.]|uniref:hybrid sensor histidine kinase/response regulator transcription factor n=1 Tax=uncultured Parabacteroides sp. TaxID=512312 RepID=UPI0025D5475B|nr:two-component regulator propeller domain-containing protein [uncultured Parabacteroides sp.]